MRTEPKTSPDKEIIKTFEAGGVVDYLEYLKSVKEFSGSTSKPG